MAAAESSFDVVSQFERQEVVNAIDQAMREVRTRFDLKGTNSQIVLEKDQIVFSAPSDFVLRALRELLAGKMARRDLSLKILDYGPVEPAARDTVRQVAKLKQGIDQDLGRQITKLIRDRSPKVKAQIQGDAVRISGRSKDELQAVIRLLKEQDYPVELQFVNYR
jgi:cyclic-di-GMP-binding protein